jgi:tetratricopeptide (TPR) repeat protein
VLNKKNKKIFSTAKMSDENENISRRRRNLESTILIWLTNKSNETKLNQLRNIIDYVQILDNTDTCNKYIEQTADDDQIYVITDAPYTSKRAQVYIYENNENFNEVIQAIETDHNAQINPFGINIFKQSTHSPLNSEFLWFQRILAVLLDSNDREKAKKNFLDAYKRYFDGNRRKEEKIQLFENTYQSTNALQWYSRECFFYEVLNKALRTQDIDVLFSLRFFLKDMYDQLKIEYDKTSRGIDLLVYRGQTISSIELQTIRDNIGQLISLNSFISTTIEEQTATGFSLSGDPSGERVFFHIKVNKTTTNPKPFADISLLSQFADEKEVLFMAGSIFEIKSTTFSDSFNMWIIELQLCDDDVYELYDVYQSDRMIVSEQKSPFSFAAVLLRMNLFDKAKKYYQQLLDEGSMNDIPSIDLIVNCYWGLSNVNRKQGELDIALAYQRLAIEQSQNRTDLLLRSYKYISLLYLDIHLIPEALEYQTKALEIQQDINDTKDQIADTLYNFGMIYNSQLVSENDRALEYFSQTLNIYKELNMHEEVIRCNDAIGQIYLEKKQKDKALNYHLQALQLIDEHYASYLPYRIDSYEYIARVYESMRDYEQAIKYYNDALHFKLKYEPLNHPHIADSYELIGGLYHKKGEYAKAIEMYDKSIELRRRIHPESHPHLESIVYTRNSLQEYTE